MCVGGARETESRGLKAPRLGWLEMSGLKSGPISEARTAFGSKNSFRKQEQLSEARTAFGSKNSFRKQEQISEARTDFGSKNSIRKQERHSEARTAFGSKSSFRKQEQLSEARTAFGSKSRFRKQEQPQGQEWRRRRCVGGDLFVCWLAVMRLRGGLLALGLVLVGCAEVRAQRLPGGVTPVHYALTITPDLAKARFAGEETIEVVVDGADEGDYAECGGD